MSRDVFVNIDSIVLHDMEGVDGSALAKALHRALTEGLAAAAPGQSVDVARAGARIDLPQGFTAVQLGRALAGSLQGVIRDVDPVHGPGDPGHGTKGNGPAGASDDA